MIPVRPATAADTAWIEALLPVDGDSDPVWYATDPTNAIRAMDEALSAARPKPPPPPLWDGHAAERIVEILERLKWTALGTPA